MADCNRLGLLCMDFSVPACVLIMAVKRKCHLSPRVMLGYGTRCAAETDCSTHSVVLYLINNNNNVWTHGLNIVCSNCRSVLIRMMLLFVTVFYTDIIICDYSQLQTALLELRYENAHAAGRSTYKVARWTIPCQ